VYTPPTFASDFLVLLRVDFGELSPIGQLLVDRSRLFL